jgi:hypothetical protein
MFLDRLSDSTGCAVHNFTITQLLALLNYYYYCSHCRRPLYKSYITELSTNHYILSFNLNESRWIVPQAFEHHFFHGCSLFWTRYIHICAHRFRRLQAFDAATDNPFLLYYIRYTNKCAYLYMGNIRSHFFLIYFC